MKKITKQFLFCALSLSALTFTSCNEDDNTGKSTLEIANGVVGTIDTPFGTDLTVDEVDEDTFEYTITLDKPQSVNVDVRVVQVGGTADADDYELSNDIITIPAYATSATGSIKILNDDTVESTEDLTLQIGTVTTSNATIEPKTLHFTINNYLSNELELTLNFSKSFSIAGTGYTICGIGYDMDFYLLDDTLADTGNYDAATGACPEHLVLDATTLADGVYHIYYDIYDDGGLSGVYHDPFTLPLTVDYMRSGGITAGTFAQESAYAPTSTDGTGSGYVMTVEVAGGVFTLKNSVPEVIASGRAASKAKAAIANARKHRR